MSLGWKWPMFSAYMETIFWLDGDRCYPASREKPSTIFATAEQPL